MKIQSVQPYSNSKKPNFRANLFVENSVKKVVKSNEEAFIKAAIMCEDWLKKEKGHINTTMFIRQNTDINPKAVFEHLVSKRTYMYPHEDTGYIYTEKVKEYEDLEFEMNHKKCGFWFDKESSAEKLLEDFKNMFNFLNK